MNDTDRTPFIFEIREEKYEELVARFAKMVGRARKCKTAAPTFSVIHEADEKKVRQTDKRENGEWVTIETWVRYLYVTVEGARPAVDGWNFIATIDHTEAYTDEAGNVIGNLVKSVPGAGEIPVSYRSAKPICNHCKSVRRRNETYIVRKSDVTMQIGKNCLADFLPGSSPADLAQQLAWWTEATEILSGGGDEESMGGGRREGRVGIESLLQATQATIEAFGWVSRIKARDSQDQATADRLGVLYMKESDMSRKDKEDAEKIRERYDVEKNTPLIEAALAWVRALDPTTTSDYEYNLHVVCKGETVRNDRVRLACSLLPAYRRFLEGERERMEYAANPSEYVGTVGERDLFEGCVLKFISEPYATDFGTSTRLVFAQGANIMVWWSSNPEGFTLGETYDLVCTPKRHEDYTNPRKNLTTKQTSINRVVVAEEKDRVKKAKKIAKLARAAAKAAEAAAA
jgi:ribosomal protein L36